MRRVGIRGQRAFMVAAAVGAAAAFFGPSKAQATDYLVDPTWNPANNGTAGEGYAGVWNSASTALLALNAGSSGSSTANPNRIFIDPGSYSLGTSFLKFGRNNYDLIGIDSQTGSFNDVVLSSTLDSDYNGGVTTIGTSNSATLMMTGNNITVANLTIANTTDTPYIAAAGHHQAEAPNGQFVGNTQTASAPAVALLTQGDGQTYDNVQILGFQDTLYMKGGRDYFVNSTISGDNDFIFANGTSVFNDDTINVDGNHSGGCITAASTDKRTSNGFVFMNSTITENSVAGSVIDPNSAAVSQATINGWTAANYTYYLGRPWGWTQNGGDSAVVYMNDTINTKNLNSAGWLNWDSTETAATNGKNQTGATAPNLMEDSRYAEYNDVDLSSNPLATNNFVSWSQTLSSAQASMYSVANIFTFDASLPNGGWYGAGYPAGDSAPGSGLPDINPAYSFPAFWGPRNSNNEGNLETAAGTTNNPTSYSNPTWTQTSLATYNPAIGLATLPEPGTIALLGVTGMLTLSRRRRKTPVQG